MKRRQVVLFAIILVALWGGLSAVLLGKGGLYVSNHEGDNVHLVDLVLRHAGGQWPHRDYMTPIGVLATAPIALFVRLGYGVGTSMLAAQVLIGAALLLPIWWVGVSRLRPGLAMLFGAVCLLMAMGLVYGGTAALDSMSMHYNRWGWALAFLAIAVVLLPPSGRQSQTADGILLGAAMAGLALLKVTYLVAFLPPVVVGLALRKEWRALKVALGVGLAVVLLITVLAGPGFWLAYLGDLWSVSEKADRAFPGATLQGVIAAPAFVGGSLLAMLSVVLLRQAGRANEGLLLLLLVPGFVYVTYQNYGNDPQWLYLLGILLLALRPEPGVVNSLGWDLRFGLTLAGCMAFAFAFPSAINLAYSPVRHLSADRDEYTPMLPRRPEHADILQLKEHEERPVGKLIVPLAGYDPSRGEAEEEARVSRLLGEPLPDCTVDSGMIVVLNTMARELEEAGFAGTAIYPADIVSGLWLFGDFQQIRGAAPWWYADLPGIEGADYLLVRFCAISARVRDRILDALEEEGYGLREAYRSEEYVLLEIQVPNTAPSAR